jgi:hypothetical protein
VLVRAMLVRRFPLEYTALEAALEAVDPMDTAYPDNPNEYEATIREALVLGETITGSVLDLDDDDLLSVLQTAARRDFGANLLDLEPDADRKMRDVVRVLREPGTPN